MDLYLQHHNNNKAQYMPASLFSYSGDGWSTVRQNLSDVNWSLPKKLHHSGCRPVLRGDGEEDKRLEESKKFTLVMLGIIVHRFSSGSNL